MGISRNSIFISSATRGSFARSESGASPEEQGGFSAREFVRRLLESGLAERWSEGERRELAALAGEGDPNLFFEDLLRLGKRLEADGRDGAAVDVYAAVVGAVPPVKGGKRERPLRILAQERLHAIQGLGAFAPRFEFLLKNFTRDAADPRAILPMLAGTTVYGLVRAAALGRLAGTARAAWYSRGAGARILAAGAAYAAEVPVFALSGRALRGLGGVSHPEASGLGHDLAGAALTLGALKGFGWAGTTAFRKLHGIDRYGVASRAVGLLGAGRVVTSQSAMFLGLLSAHRLEAAFGLHPARDGATTLTDTLASMLSLGVGAHLGHRLLGRRFAAFQRELGLRVQAQDMPRLNPPDANFGNFAASIGAVRACPPLRGERPLRGWQGEARSGPAGRSPGSPQHSYSLGSGSGRPSRAPGVRGEVERLLDHPRLDIAWTILKRWGEFESRLRAEDISYLAAKLEKRLDAKGELPPLLAALMMRHLLPQLPEGEALPILRKLESKLADPEERVVEAALESLAAYAPRASAAYAEGLLPALRRVAEADHDWLPAKAFQALGAFTEALPPERRLAHVLALESRMSELELSPVAVLPRALSFLSPGERVAVARVVERRLFEEEAGGSGERRETLGQIFPLLPVVDGGAMLARLQTLAEAPKGPYQIPALEILGEWSGNFSARERAELLPWAARFLDDSRLTLRMTALQTLWKLAMASPVSERLAAAAPMEKALGDGSAEAREAAVAAWGLLAAGLPPEQRLAVAERLLARHSDPAAAVRDQVWKQLSEMAEALEARPAAELLRLALSQVALAEVPIRFLQSVEKRIPKEALAASTESAEGRDFFRYATYLGAGLPLEPILWKAYLRAAKPEAFLAKAGADLSAFRRGGSPKPGHERQLLLAYAALEVWEGLGFEDFRRGIRGKAPPPPFLTQGFRAELRTQVSLHGRIDKGKVAQALAPLEKPADLEAFREDLDAFIQARHSELRAVRQEVKAVFPKGWEKLRVPAMSAAAEGLLPRLWPHRELPAVRELILRFGLFLAWHRLEGSPLAARISALRGRDLSSKALGEGLKALEEFYRDAVTETFGALGLKAEEIPALRRQSRLLAAELARMRREEGAPVEVEFLSSKTEADRFFAFVSEDCNTERQRAIFRPDFQLLRMVSDGRLRGLVYVQKAALDGKEVLVLGLQPRASWAIDHRDLLRAVEREFSRVAEAKGYDAVLLMADENQQSNRADMLEAIRERAYPRKSFRQKVSGAVFEGREFQVLWERGGRRSAAAGKK